jgi:hypothetical protein
VLKNVRTCVPIFRLQSLVFLQIFRFDLNIRPNLIEYWHLTTRWKYILANKQNVFSKYLSIKEYILGPITPIHHGTSVDYATKPWSNEKKSWSRHQLWYKFCSRLIWAWELRKRSYKLSALVYSHQLFSFFFNILSSLAEDASQSKRDLFKKTMIKHLNT